MPELLFFSFFFKLAWKLEISVVKSKNDLYWFAVQNAVYQLSLSQRNGLRYRTLYISYR